MPELFVNPNLPNYFVSADEVTSAASARSYVAEYEDAKVITFPNLKADIDRDFWSSFGADRFPSLKKFGFYLDTDDRCDVERQAPKLVAQGVDQDVAMALSNQFNDVLATLMPIYRAIFSDYRFNDAGKKVVWRLNAIMNENMHVDTYKEENENHFARMFINLDNQPRIWQTSWPIDDIIERLGTKLPASSLQGKTRGEAWMAINNATFGKSSKEWWDREPRHVAYFAPGDVWIVDSRQISHQIFYGRRALSIDFFIPKEGMNNPDRHYLEIAARFLAEAQREMAA